MGETHARNNFNGRQTLVSQCKNNKGRKCSGSRRRAGVRSAGRGIQREFLEEEEFELGLERWLRIREEALGKRGREGLVWSLACWVVPSRGLSASLGNFELSRERDMSHRNYTDRLEIDLKTQLCDFTERERLCQPGVRTLKVTGIIRHWADQHFFFINMTGGLKRNLGMIFTPPDHDGFLHCLFPSSQPQNISSLNAKTASSQGSLRPALTNETKQRHPLELHPHPLVGKPRQRFGGSLSDLFHLSSS